MSYANAVPKLWTETIDAHRRAVHDATVETAAALVAKFGLRSVTMSRIAEETGIGRATLYKYFPDVEAILVAWLERHVAGHLAHLVEVRDRAAKSGDPLEAVLEAYASILQEPHGHRDSALAAVLHADERVVQAQRRLHDVLRDLLATGAASGRVRADVSPDELAAFCLHALSAAETLPSGAAVRRLVAVTMGGLRPPR